jgi:hypothetical protein
MQSKKGSNNMPTLRSHTYHNTLFKVHRLEVFNPETNTWTVLYHSSIKQNVRMFTRYTYGVSYDRLPHVDTYGYI